MPIRKTPPSKRAASEQFAWEDLAVLLAVSQTGNMSQAATRLNKTQPTISRALTDLEKRLGATLVERAKGRKGISAFVVERGTVGLNAGKKEEKLGMRASETAEVLLENCRIPADQLIGEEGQGFIQTLQVLDAGRIGIAALAVGLAQGAYDCSRAYARERKQFNTPIGDFPSIRGKLARHRARVEAARLLTYRAAWLKDQGRRMTLESSMAKLYASEIAVRASEDAVQIHGGYGFVKDYPAEKFFRDVKLTTIGEGTSEIQRLVIARQLLAQ